MVMRDDIFKEHNEVEARNPYYLQDTEGNYYNKYPEFQIWEDGHKAGMKEVVDFIENYRRGEGYYQFELEDWQAFLKSEG